MKDISKKIIPETLDFLQLDWFGGFLSKKLAQGWQAPVGGRSGWWKRVRWARRIAGRFRAGKHLLDEFWARHCRPGGWTSSGNYRAPCGGYRRIL